MAARRLQQRPAPWQAAPRPVARDERADEIRAEMARSSRPIAFFPCECGRPACVLTVPLTAREYDAIRPEPVRAKVHRPIVGLADRRR